MQRGASPYFLGVSEMKYIVNSLKTLPEDHGVNIGDIGEFVKEDDSGILLRNNNWLADWWFYHEDVKPVLINRDFLSDFLKINNIKKTLVSKYLGYSQNWLTQMANDKRRDMTDETLQSIMKKLHIDWTKEQWINVKGEVPYRTNTKNYKTDAHKERLQRAMWDGLFVK